MSVNSAEKGASVKPTSVLYPTTSVEKFMVTEIAKLHNSLDNVGAENVRPAPLGPRQDDEFGPTFLGFCQDLFASATNAHADTSGLFFAQKSQRDFA